MAHFTSSAAFCTTCARRARRCRCTICCTRSPDTGVILELQLLGLGLEVRVLQGAMNALRSAAARSGGRSGGEKNGRPITCRAANRLIICLFFLGLGEIAGERDVRQLGMLLVGELDQDVDLLLVEPLAVHALHARPGEGAAALRLAALDRDRHLVAAGIAADDLELGAKHAVEDLRHGLAFVARSGGGDDQFLLPHLLEGRDAGLVPRGAQAHLVVGAAEPEEFLGVELRALHAEQRPERAAASHGGERGAVLRRLLVHEVGQPDRARAFHVARHDRRVAGNVLADVARDHAAVEVVGAAGREADIHADGLAFVELGDRLRVRARRQETPWQRMREQFSHRSGHSSSHRGVMPANAAQ